MGDVFFSAWFYWAVGIAFGLPLGLVVLTEWQHALQRKRSALLRPVTILRNYLLPLAALLLLMLEANQIPAQATSVRVVGTLVAFVILVLLLSGINAALFQSAPDGSWRKRMPSIFLDVLRFVLIAVGLAMIFAYIWGANVKGLFTALGITSIVVGLTLQNSVGQIISGLLMLFEQPFKIGDWIETPQAKGRVVEVNWRAIHLETGTGLQITPNSVLASASFTNLSRPTGKHTAEVITVFASEDAPDKVCAMLTRVASELPLCDPDRSPGTVPFGGAQYKTKIPLTSPAEDGKATAMFRRWVWYSARREGLHLDEADDSFSSPELVEEGIVKIVGPTFRLSHDEHQDLIDHARIELFGDGEMIQRAGEVPSGMMFVLSGTIQMMAILEDGSQVVAWTQDEGSFVGQSTLTRQPVLGSAYAVGEVAVVYVGRDMIADLVQRNPELLQELGRTIDERRAHVLRAIDQATDADID
ncbi:small-conductance mechanosensitive channel/CRP-like cAMP-binding protein [Mycolicibacterium sp. BK556]|uniref:mechanosensitive ion channel domain-containing protein n=1 Tax=unclassified Mycolicibacterium TaxID=2636767 RepID=UPI0016117688|nr:MULTISPECIES: mechanosensitive ion channel domain-containing protein [unclassified Mycolicibacterium]MBB3603738.1 small-conductance mechanosensitive channel/CRP-like cAMP-binding protein [Mycolicibacterium sp. BK556]MBB3633933.1 small-conductance mechanosensitive channel/CRP-like cAMP-binding protein [Mycolicibacterium sp. BK607]MBB3751515.1 small-conductance mechanosensitive channel/CRP-like cAMP-binding protein [Mycolicibacterium sp. BK634]